MNDDQLVTSVSIHDAALSDHFVGNGVLSMEKPLFIKKQIVYRSYKNFDIDLFTSDIRGSSLISDSPNELDDLVALYDSELSGVFNRRVPIKKRTVTIRPAAPWYSEELKSEKRGKRQLERRWRASRSVCDREVYMRQCKVLKDMLFSSRSNYYSNLVANMRSLFAAFSKLLHGRHEVEYPKHDSSSSLANDFVLFFGNKIKRIRRDLDQVPPLDTPVDNGTNGCQLNMISTVPPDELLGIIGSTTSKSFDLDPVPGHVLKCLFPSILLVIYTIVNLSLETGRMPEILKQAILKPLLTKPSLDSNDFKNYRPISNLRFISKTIEKCVAKQLIQHLDINDLGETNQSAYKRNHNAETALVRVQNDIAMAIDRHNSVILVLVDLSAAFDTVDHGILLSRQSLWNYWNCIGMVSIISF